MLVCTKNITTQINSADTINFRDEILFLMEKAQALSPQFTKSIDLEISYTCIIII